MHSNNPPKYAGKLLALFCDEYWLDELLGALEEEYKDNLKSQGKTRANLSYYSIKIAILKPVNSLRSE